MEWISGVITALGGWQPLLLIILVLGCIILAPTIMVLIYQTKSNEAIMLSTDKTAQRITETFQEANREVVSELRALNSALAILPLLVDRVGRLEQTLTQHDREAYHVIQTPI